MKASENMLRSPKQTCLSLNANYSVCFEQGGMVITVRTEGVRLVMRDGLRQPLLELELGPMDGAAQRLAPGVLKVLRRLSIVSTTPSTRN